MGCSCVLCAVCCVLCASPNLTPPSQADEAAAAAAGAHTIQYLPCLTRKGRRTDSFEVVCQNLLQNFLPIFFHRPPSLITLNLLKHNIEYHYTLHLLHCSRVDPGPAALLISPCNGLEQPRTANIPLLQAYHLAKVAPRALRAVLPPALRSLNLPYIFTPLPHLLKLEEEANSILVRQHVELHSAKGASSQHRCPY